ncbi:MAG: hypothetical protein ALECFALPRED_002792 [Alectoria fallacina]|uniref:Uncharacterized protein n=1 Tax=Alectoria fallacina TaxID=1903189 RepID=A0A8H3FH87_9LECA|nr:MAG: hypothetical protein ALECFALPRED_002792 [Alectoria fallacina]
MCRIERFDVVYPNGTREKREQWNHCRRGTRSQPCRYVQVSNLEDRLASASDLRHEIQPHIIPIEPRDSESSRLRPSSRETPRAPIQGLALNLKFWNPFSSKTKEKNEKTKYFFVRRTREPEPRPTVIKHQSPIPPPPEPYFSTSVRGESPVVTPIQHPDYQTTRDLPEREPRRRRRRRRPTPVVIHQMSEEDRDESPSPPEANREHHRRTRSLSPLSRYEFEKEVIRLRELRQREHRERITREEREARERAERVALLERRERQREREEQSEWQERRESRERQRLAAEREARRQQEERDREEARRLQEQEDLERLRAADRARQLREERARRQQEEEDSERRRAAYRDRLRRLRDEQTRRRYAEEQRNARARQANIPRPPRHHVFVHQNEGHLDRGERFIQDAIRVENLRQFERRAGWPGRGYDDGDNGLRRRNTIDGGQRWRRDRR